MIVTDLQRQQLLCAYLLTLPKGVLIPKVQQPWPVLGKSKLCDVYFTRYYFEHIAKGGRFYQPMDLLGIDEILTEWDREVAR